MRLLAAEKCLGLFFENCTAIANAVVATESIPRGIDQYVHASPPALWYGGARKKINAHPRELYI